MRVRENPPGSEADASLPVEIFRTPWFKWFVTKLETHLHFILMIVDDNTNSAMILYVPSLSSTSKLFCHGFL